MRRLALFLVAIAGCSSCDEAEATAPYGDAAFCRSCSEPASLGRVGRPSIDEASGLCASRRGPHLYVHNDSGDRARFFAVDTAGRDLGSYEVTGARAVDWEDAAVGPCPEGSCVFLADIGDNDEERDGYVVHRVPEPATVGPGAHQIAGVTLPFQYPDGSHNAETLLVDDAGDVFVVTKARRGPSIVFRFPRPHTPGSSATLERVAEITIPAGSPLVTAGSLAGSRLLLRTYSSVWYYELGNAGLGGIGAPTCSLPVPPELQGETITWYDGSSYLTVSEGQNAKLYRVTCTTEAP
jgi:hypothetical protein